MKFRVINKILNYIFAEDEEFSLEYRLLLSAIVVGILTSIVGTIINAILTTSLTASVIPFFLSSFLFVVYYLIRVKKIIKPIIIPLVIISIVSISIIWLSNGGMDGANSISALVILVLTLIIVEDKHKKYLLFFFLFCIFTIYLIEFFKPELISRFDSREERWFDEFLTILYSSVFIFLIIKYLHRNYQKERQNAIESQKQLLKLNADKNKFISILGHDLRGPLSGVLMFLNYFEEHLDKFDKKEIEGKITLLNTSTKEVYKMLEDILTWGKAQMLTFPFQPSSVNFEYICKGVVDKLKLLAANKNIEIKLDGNCKVEVFTDQEILIVILRNLISNAIKFTRNDGRVQVSVVPKKDHHLICVEDNGVGIRSEKLIKLFDIAQIHTTLGTEREKGSGMGLLLCKEYVEKHKGKIWAESISGEGSKFCFTLPYNKKEVQK